MVLMVMASWWAELLDVQGAFLTLGRWIPRQSARVREALPSQCCLTPTSTQETLYGLKQSAYEFWKMLVLVAMRHMQFERSKADPCLFFKWTTYGLTLWVTWVDDCLVCGNKTWTGVLQAKDELMDARFDRL
jgi:hypothetical protein